MATLESLGLTYVEEDEAEGEIADLFDEVRRSLQTPNVPKGFKVLSGSTAAFTAYWAMYSNFIMRTVLPEPLIAMVLYAIAESNDCTYCSTLNEASCRMYGVDDATLTALARDLGHVTPLRVQAIVRFALMACHSPKDLTREDFDTLRAHGLSDEEIFEITFLAAVGQLNDILADTLKAEPDEMFIT